ncbi:hypothetical protein [Kitasatospora phosalacinea]|uniref:Uncharacterized protein n=1 Tax=Kitasatospora phosalacinea TaxID=2065 RepID=A0A9W6PIS2_9ACTN|nr:hypothetical protein [Kitasatospora phosalacinea]GLW55582.1 hypothetical protein Kpho01_35930 [Kitasatospora phosalacinea]
MSLHPAGPEAGGGAVTRHWSGRLLDAGLRQHTAEAAEAAEASEATEATEAAASEATMAAEAPRSTDSPSPQPSCPPEDAR